MSAVHFHMRCCYVRLLKAWEESWPAGPGKAHRSWQRADACCEYKDHVLERLWASSKRVVAIQILTSKRLLDQRMAQWPLFMDLPNHTKWASCKTAVLSRRLTNKSIFDWLQAAESTVSFSKGSLKSRIWFRLSHSRQCACDRPS
jgi:hypothetical protein